MRDHPRIRGTNCLKDECEENAPGSSPHTRDKWAIQLLSTVDGGIIPAYAGQISSRESRTRAEEDHPRIRGTNIAHL